MFKKIFKTSHTSLNIILVKIFIYQYFIYIVYYAFSSANFHFSFEGKKKITTKKKEKIFLKTNIVMKMNLNHRKNIFKNEK